MIVYREIYSQLMHLGKIEVWSWGAHAFKGLRSDQMADAFGAHNGALIFKVNGRLFNGHVAIVLMLNDTYTIFFGALARGAWRNRQSAVTDVYIEQLIEVIDNKVEVSPAEIVGCIE